MKEQTCLNQTVTEIQDQINKNQFFKKMEWTSNHGHFMWIRKVPNFWITLKMFFKNVAKTN